MVLSLAISTRWAWIGQADTLTDIRGHPSYSITIDIVTCQDFNAAIGDGMKMFVRADPRSGRAFVIASNGHYGFAIGKDAQAKATKACEERGGVGCQLYAFGNDLVYKGPFAAGGKTAAAPSVNDQ
ncbi:hypothetical protein PQR14_13155 [Paraburkholderia bryophila]|uniref:hypothetical protein n=1 Tax=Burkholderiaceae TaxID=119060 RepID=UPI0012DFFD4D|nr:hypothetical protein [Burkholderia sp. 9120]